MINRAADIPDTKHVVIPGYPGWCPKGECHRGVRSVPRGAHGGE